jgi:hypothetical protein
MCFSSPLTKPSITARPDNKAGEGWKQSRTYNYFIDQERKNNKIINKNSYYRRERIPFDWQTRKNQVYLKPNNTIYYLVYMEQDRGVQVDHAHPLDISPDM